MTDTNTYVDSFAILDADRDGKISATELLGLMRALGDDVTEEAAARAVELMDTDGDGLVSLEEFSGWQSSRRAGGPAAS